MKISQLTTSEQVLMLLADGSAKQACKGLGPWLGTVPPCGLWRVDSSVYPAVDSMIPSELQPSHATTLLPFLTPQSLP